MDSLESGLIRILIIYCAGAGDGHFGIWFDHDLNHVLYRGWRWTVWNLV